MPIVEVREQVRAPVRAVWDLVCDVKAYPQLMEPVRSIKVLDEGDDWVIAAWEVELKGSILKWIERGEWDSARYHFAYRQLEGDLELFDGFWQLQEVVPNVTDAILMVRFEIGIPMLKEMLDPVTERAIRENSRTMLLSLVPRHGG